MKYAKIIVKNNYERKGDLVLRSYIRAIKKIKANLLLGLNLFSDTENAFIYGIIKEDNKFHELFTDRIIDYDNYEIVPDDGIIILKYIPIDEIEKIKKIIEKVIFNDNIDLDFEVSTEEDLALDRKIESIAYDKRLSGIMPYPRLGEEETGYNNFQKKIEIIKKMKKQNKEVDNTDEYEVHSYQERPKNEEDYDYLVFEVPKVKTLRK